MVERYGMPPLKASYYLRAMNVFADRFGRQGTTPLFLLVTDDRGWVESHLLPRASGFRARLAGTGDPGSAEYAAVDLAILSRCNHTILSYGTYSFWAGFLSGGMRVTPAAMFNNPGRVPQEALNLPPFVYPDQGLEYDGASSQIG